MHNRLRGVPDKNKLRHIPVQLAEMQLLDEARLNGGIVNALDATDIANNQLSYGQNIFVRYDRTERRNGMTILTPTKPTSTPVLLVTAYEDFSSTVSFLRFTTNKVHKRAGGSWTEITSGTAISGTSSDRFNITNANDQFFFSNNGVDYIQKINFAANTYARLGNAPKYRYITSFSNRIVGANLAGLSPSPIQIGWSGDLNFAEWDPLVDISAGFGPLVESQSDASDDITGLFGFATRLVILRERTVWFAIKQASASNPFYFFTGAPNVGCDSPWSAVKIPDGIAWYDHRSKSIYTLNVNGSQPDSQAQLSRIGAPIEVMLAQQVADQSKLFASYDPFNAEYSLVIPPVAGTINYVWTYSFKTQAWSFGTLDGVSCVSDTDFNSGSVYIDDLIGPIDTYTGTIDSYGKSNAQQTRFFGFTTGEIKYSDPTADTDDGTTYATVVESKSFLVPSSDAYVAQLVIDYIPRKAGSFSLYYTKDNGRTYTLYKAVTFTNSDIGVRLTKTFTKNIKVGIYRWKLEASSGLFEIVNYALHYYPGAKRKQDG